MMLLIELNLCSTHSDCVCPIPNLVRGVLLLHTDLYMPT